MKAQSKLIVFSFCMLLLIAITNSAGAVSSRTEDVIQPNIQLIIQQYNISEERSEEIDPKQFKLPSSLIIIEDEAFEGTAIEKAELPDTVESIGENAFANIATLKNINIPNSTTFIGKDAFRGSNQVTITAAPKSYARAYALENKIPFNPITGFYAFIPPTQSTSPLNDLTEQQKLLDEEETTDNQRANQTGRMTGDLNADRYEIIMAFHIQGRSPPMG